jgi:hypothetical protein
LERRRQLLREQEEREQKEREERGKDIFIFDTAFK